MTYKFLFLLGLFPIAAMAAPHGKAHHVVIISWDGMRPDFVSEAGTPNLWRLAKGGVFFRRHHPVWLASTEVNGTAIATGAYPEHSGLMANREYRPEVDSRQPVGTEMPDTITKAKQPYLLRPTTAELLHAAGMHTAIAGTKRVALLHDWKSLASPAAGSVVFFDGKTTPPGAMAQLAGTLGPWPETIEFPNLPEDAWTTRALAEVLWKDGVPPFSLLWMSDPDYSQHQLAPGSPLALAALKSVDDRLGAVLAALEKAGARDDTDVFVVSDHGFSTVTQPADLTLPIAAAGIKVSGSAFDHNPAAGEVLTISSGGSVLFYVIGHDREIGRRLADVVQKNEATGVVFSRWGLPGTFDLRAAHVATPSAPDLVVSYHWTSGTNAYGAPGTLAASGVRPGKGTHASLSPYDMHNTLIAAGPDFRAGWEDETPSGNIDLAPTALWILGVRHPPMDGRVLLEAMPGHKLGRKVSTATLEASNGGWKQHLVISRVGTTEYIDEGDRGAGHE